nr:hypothetical protein [Tanacetum cinerariifolium]
MKEGTDWRKVSLGSSEAYIANDTLSTLHLQLTTEVGRCLKCHLLRAVSNKCHRLLRTMPTHLPSVIRHMLVTCLIAVIPVFLANKCSQVYDVRRHLLL